MCPSVELIREDHVRISRHTVFFELPISLKTWELLRGADHLRGKFLCELVDGQRDLVGRPRWEQRSYAENSPLLGERQAGYRRKW